MSQRRIGLVMEIAGPDLKSALQAIARLGFSSIDLPATGEASPEALSATGRRHLAHFARGLGLDLFAVGADPGGARFADLHAVERHLASTRLAMELARDLQTRIVTTNLGRVDEASLAQGPLRDAVRQLAELSDRIGVGIAFETDSDPALLARLLAEANCRGLGACYDPASLLIDGFDPIRGVETLSNDIVAARVRDALAASGNRAGREAPFGQGHLDFDTYFAALESAGYRAPIFIRRTGPDRTAHELAAARERLQHMLM